MEACPMTRSKPPKIAHKHEPRQHAARTIADRDAAIAVLREFLDEGDEKQQRQTWRYLKEALDELRPEGEDLISPYIAERGGRIPQTAKDIDWSRWDPQRAIALLDRFMEEDEEEQRETLAYLKKALDEGRPDGEKLFP
jgi:hypothetical protein